MDINGFTINSIDGYQQIFHLSVDSDIPHFSTWMVFFQPSPSTTHQDPAAFPLDALAAMHKCDADTKAVFQDDPLLGCLIDWFKGHITGKSHISLSCGILETCEACWRK